MGQMTRLVPFAVLVAAIVGGGGPATGAGPIAPIERARANGIDVSGIVETVSHRLRPDSIGFFANDRRYRLQLSGDGLALRLRARSKKARTAPSRQSRRHSRSV